MIDYLPCAAVYRGTVPRKSLYGSVKLPQWSQNLSPEALSRKELKALIEDIVTILLNEAAEADIELDYDDMLVKATKHVEPLIQTEALGAVGVDMERRGVVSDAIQKLVDKEVTINRIANLVTMIQHLSNLLNDQVNEARELGATWREIGDAAGTTHSTAMRRWGGDDDDI